MPAPAARPRRPAARARVAVVRGNGNPQEETSQRSGPAESLPLPIAFSLAGGPRSSAATPARRRTAGAPPSQPGSLSFRTPTSGRLTAPTQQRGAARRGAALLRGATRPAAPRRGLFAPRSLNLAPPAAGEQCTRTGGLSESPAAHETTHAEGRRVPAPAGRLSRTRSPDQPPSLCDVAAGSASAPLDPPTPFRCFPVISGVGVRALSGADGTSAPPRVAMTGTIARALPRTRPSVAPLCPFCSGLPHRPRRRLNPAAPAAAAAFVRGASPPPPPQSSRRARWPALWPVCRCVAFAVAAPAGKRRHVHITPSN